MRICSFCCVLGIAAGNSAQKSVESCTRPMVASPSCLIHFKGETGQLTSFTRTSFGKVVDSHMLWLSLDGQQREVAERIAPTLNIRSLDDSSIDNLHYHRDCYSKFTNVTLIKRAQARCSKKREKNVFPEDTKDLEENVDPGPTRKLTRSSTQTAVRSRSQAVLPPVCIICNKEKTYLTEKVSGRKCSTVFDSIVCHQLALSSPCFAIRNIYLNKKPSQRFTNK
jgi:hypothetical protein